MATFPTRAEPANEALFIHPVLLAINPTVAYGLFNGIVVRNRRFPSSLVVEYQPDFPLGLVVVSKPLPELLSGDKSQGFARIHTVVVSLSSVVWQEILPTVKRTRWLVDHTYRSWL
jgi:hypothetical protein